MTEPGNGLAAGAGAHGHLRASNADREQVIDSLKTAFVLGRLDRDELDLRVGQALASRTYADLIALTADLPVRLPRARPPQPVKESVSKAAVASMTCATAALVGLLPVMMLRPPWPHSVLLLATLWFALAVAVPTGWLMLVRDWLDKSSTLRAATRLSAPGPRLPAPHARC